MNSERVFYTEQQLKVFAEDLFEAFERSGFEIVEEPYIDYTLHGFRATYIRRYTLNRPTSYCDGVLTTLIHVVGFPFGCQSQKMVILSAPRDVNNEPVAETLRLRVHFDDNGQPHAIQHEQPPDTGEPTNHKCNDLSSDNSFAANYHLYRIFDNNQSNQQPSASSQQTTNSDFVTSQFTKDLLKYVSHIIEIISPGLIQLPIEMKLEVLKKLSVDSIIKMSQVNSEFRSLIFHHGESLWRHLCKRDFGIVFINRLVHRSWMELYRDNYITRQIETCRKERALPGLPDRPALPPAPYMLQIEWLPEVLELPFYEMNDVVIPERLPLALELHPLRRADSLDSI